MEYSNDEKLQLYLQAYREGFDGLKSDRFDLKKKAGSQAARAVFPELGATVERYLGSLHHGAEPIPEAERALGLALVRGIRALKLKHAFEIEKEYNRIRDEVLNGAIPAGDPKPEKITKRRELSPRETQAVIDAVRAAREPAFDPAVDHASAKALAEIYEAQALKFPALPPDEMVAAFSGEALAIVRAARQILEMKGFKLSPTPNGWFGITERPDTTKERLDAVLKELTQLVRNL